jgi:hypothetical protein
MAINFPFFGWLTPIHCLRPPFLHKALYEQPTMLPVLCTSPDPCLPIYHDHLFEFQFSQGDSGLPEATDQITSCSVGHPRS